MVFDGYASVTPDLQKIPCHFENNVLKLYYEDFFLPEGEMYKTDVEDDHLIKVWKRGYLSRNYYLMHLFQPLSIFERLPIPHTANYDVNWFISDYDPMVFYNQLNFRFDELDYFTCAFLDVQNDDTEFMIRKDEKILEKFSFVIDGKRVNVKLATHFEIINRIPPSVQRISQLSMSFRKTRDLEFLYKLYWIVLDTFSFLCNRRNLTLNQAILEGTTPQNQRKYISTLCVIDKYKEPNEGIDGISKTIHYADVRTHFAGLVRLIASNYDSKTKGKVSVRGIHPSFFKRNLIDLQQSLNITSAFEFHSRVLMPEISSEDTNETYDEIKRLIEDQYIKIASGKKKKVAKDIVKKLEPMLSLGDKIKKAISGYDKWKSLESVVNQAFPNWEALAKEANEWRNEVAHEKREAIPTRNTINAIRMVELLNYCLILRASGFSNKSISKIVFTVLDIRKTMKTNDVQ